MHKTTLEPCAHPERAESLMQLGELYDHMGMYLDAKEYYQQAIDSLSKTHETPPLSLIHSLSKLAQLLQTTEQLTQAEALYLEALHLAQNTPDEQHSLSLVLDLMSHLGALYLRQTHYQKALPLYKQITRTRTIHYGKTHPMTLSAINTLAELYHKLGDLKRALPLYHQVLKRQQMLLGAKHLATTRVLGILAELHYQRRDFVRACDYYEQLIRLRGKPRPSGRGG